MHVQLNHVNWTMHVLTSTDSWSLSYMSHVVQYFMYFKHQQRFLIPRFWHLFIPVVLMRSLNHWFHCVFNCLQAAGSEAGDSCGSLLTRYAWTTHATEMHTLDILD